MCVIDPRTWELKSSGGGRGGGRVGRMCRGGDWGGGYVRVSLRSGLTDDARRDERGRRDGKGHDGRKCYLFVQCRCSRCWRVDRPARTRTTNTSIGSVWRPTASHVVGSSWWLPPLRRPRRRRDIVRTRTIRYKYTILYSPSLSASYNTTEIVAASRRSGRQSDNGGSARQPAADLQLRCPDVII